MIKKNMNMDKSDTLYRRDYERNSNLNSNFDNTSDIILNNTNDINKMNSLNNISNMTSISNIEASDMKK